MAEKHVVCMEIIPIDASIHDVLATEPRETDAQLSAIPIDRDRAHQNRVRIDLARTAFRKLDNR